MKAKNSRGNWERIIRLLFANFSPGNLSKEEKFALIFGVGKEKNSRSIRNFFSISTSAFPKAEKVFFASISILRPFEPNLGGFLVGGIRRIFRVLN